jgi:7,8-dihydropterin-6-yl-methyl-4-(beta-D-ribofuranosyl)aminobenzene 5'-phosphate synthase
MKNIRNLSVFVFLVLINQGLSGQVYENLEDYKGIDEISPGSGIRSSVTMVVLYDNYIFQKGTKADWGFSLLLTGLDKEVLFDAGARPDVLEYNLSATGIDPSGIQMLVFSHEHGDHTGGISALAKLKNGIPVVIPESFSKDFKLRLVNLGYKPVMVKAPSQICRNLYTSGGFEFDIPEETLVLDTRNGLVVITGCAHPGIIDMLRKIKKDFGKNIYMVCGGFHLMDKNDNEMVEIISQMKDLGVVRCGATHCTGEKQIKMFREAYGDNYVELGTGNRIVIN